MKVINHTFTSLYHLCNVDVRLREILDYISDSFFSSPEQKAQVSLCHPFSSVVRGALTFYIFIFFTRTGGRVRISTKLGGDHP